jgi:nanoRNase/pAp phosphatase (c-di-AMP/oligoRNAs hydrolase)
MSNQAQTEEIKKVLDPAKSVFVLLPQNPNLDAAAAALSLFLSLKEAGKNTFIGSPTKMRVEFSTLVGIDRVSDKIGNRNLIISFDYAEDAIEKVSYNVEEGKFNLVIEPKSEHPPLDSKKVNFSYEGIEAPLIFIVGAKKLEDLGALYEKDRQAFNQTSIVNVDRATTNTKFGQINLVNSGAAALSEIIYKLLKNLNLPLNIDIAGNLLKGIEVQTQNLQAPFASPDTFETVAQLMRAGAKRTPSVQTQARPWTTRPPTAQMPRPGISTPQKSAPQPQPQPQPPTPPTPQTPPPTATQLAEPKLDIRKTQSQMQAPIRHSPSSQGQVPPPPPSQDQARQRVQIDQKRKNPRQNEQQMRDDWTKPKIYKGSTKV